MFVDEVVVTLNAGDGGKGCVSFRREKYEPRGGPNGGDGGKGGNVVLSCVDDVSDLSSYRYNPNHQAQNGEPGRGSDQNGRGGEDCILKVPPGTLVISEATGKPVADLVEDGTQVVLLRGGNGGWGNKRFKSSVNQAPRRANDGLPGEQGRFRLVLKTVAEVGLVGFPNAGKSSLTNIITKAHPRCAAYPFTTLQPQIGIIEYPGLFERVILADIPGLIDGASRNRGLGHQFLRHIERCRVLLIMIDIAGTEERDPLDDYAALLQELRLYSEELLVKPRLVVANKMDLDGASENLDRIRREIDLPVLPLSCISGEGIDELKQAILDAVLAVRQSDPVAPARPETGSENN
jgi:GTPase